MNEQPKKTFLQLPYEEQQERLRNFLCDLVDQEYAPCGCWKSRRTGETIIFCTRHLDEEIEK